MKLEISALRIQHTAEQFDLQEKSFGVIYESFKEESTQGFKLDGFTSEVLTKPPLGLNSS